MTNFQRLSAVRDCIKGWITQHTNDSGATDPRGETTLIQDGYFCGRRFRFPHHHAVWFLEEDLIKIRDLQGNLLATLQGDQINQTAENWRAELMTLRSTISIASETSSKRTSVFETTQPRRQAEAVPQPQRRAA
jgi:hypothetical protein